MTPPPRLKCLIPLRCPLVAQTDPASTAAAGEDLPAIGSGHPLPEAVDLAALTLLGLIGTEHTGTPPIFVLADRRGGLSTTTPGRPDAVVMFKAHECASDIIPEEESHCQPYFLLFHLPSPGRPQILCSKNFTPQVPSKIQKSFCPGNLLTVAMKADFCYNNVVKELTSHPPLANREMSEKEAWIPPTRSGNGCSP